MWSAAHLDRMCPERLADLLPYVKNGSESDLWGHPYVMQCGSNLPAGAKAIAIHSVGPDGKDGTADDVTSWL